MIGLQANYKVKQILIHPSYLLCCETFRLRSICFHKKAVAIHFWSFFFRLIRPLVALVAETRLLVQLMSHDVNIPHVSPIGQQPLFVRSDRSCSLRFIMFCFETSNRDQSHLNVNLTSGCCETVSGFHAHERLCDYCVSSIFIIPLKIRLYIEDGDEDENKNNKYLHGRWIALKNLNYVSIYNKSSAKLRNKSISFLKNCNLAIRKICFHFPLIVLAYSIHKESEEEAAEVRSNIIRVPRQSRGAFF